MEIDFTKIVRLTNVRIMKSELSREEMELTTPMLKDLRLISSINKRIRELSDQNVSENAMGTTYNRRVFLFIVLYLYAPIVLSGGRLPAGLRDEIANVCNVNAKSVISDNCSSAVFMYQNYKGFKHDVDNAYCNVMQWLKSENLIQ